MTIVKFLSDLKGLGVNIWVEDEQLRYRAPKGVITSNLKQELIGRKKDIIAFLQQAKIGNKTTDTVFSNRNYREFKYLCFGKKYQ